MVSSSTAVSLLSLLLMPALTASIIRSRTRPRAPQPAPPLAIPDNYDLRQFGVVTDVLPFGCGFASPTIHFLVDQVNTNFALVTNTSNVTLMSEHQLFDCGFSYGDDPHPFDVGELMAKYNGLQTEHDYTNQPGSGCKFNASLIAAKVSSYWIVQPGNETELRDQLFIRGAFAVTVAIDPGLQNYR